MELVFLRRVWSAPDSSKLVHMLEYFSGMFVVSLNIPRLPKKLGIGQCLRMRPFVLQPETYSHLSVLIKRKCLISREVLYISQSEAEILHGVLITDIIFYPASLQSVFTVFSKSQFLWLLLLCAWVIDWLTGPGMNSFEALNGTTHRVHQKLSSLLHFSWKALQSNWNDI